MLEIKSYTTVADGPGGDAAWISTRGRGLDVSVSRLGQGVYGLDH